MNKTRILIADDHKLMRMGLVSLLNVQPDMTVVGEAEDGRQAIELADRLAPDIVIMDLMMPNVGGAEATAEIRRRHPCADIVILTSYANSDELSRALASGAHGVQTKESSPEGLLRTIRTVRDGKLAIPADLRSPDVLEPLPGLTPRQLQILALVARGLTNKAIAGQTGISPVSVKKHLSVIFSKLGAESRSEAVAIALRKHLLKD